MDAVVRRVLAGGLVAATISVFASAAVAEEVPVSVILLGDSYINSQGVAGPDVFAVRLQAALQAVGAVTKTINTGYRDKTADGLSWIRDSPIAHKIFASPANNVVILELGSNDCGEPKLEKTRANLDQILAQFSESHIPVLVVGTHSYSICEHFSRPTYPTEYFQMFADLAEKYGDLYYPDFKEGVSDHPELMQPGTDHPNAKGDAAIAAKMLPIVLALIARATRP